MIDSESASLSRTRPILMRYLASHRPNAHIRPRDLPKEKTCPRCGLTRPVTEFRRDFMRKDGYSTFCSQCIASRRK